MKRKLALLLLVLNTLVACGAPTTTPATTGAPTTAAQAPAVATAAPATTTEAAPATTEAAPTATTEAAPTATTEATSAATTEAVTASAGATDAPTLATTSAPAAAETTGTSQMLDLKGAPAATIADTNGAYYQLQSQGGVRENRCLEGQGGAAPGSGAVLDGAGFMDKCQNVTGQIWKLMPDQDGYFRLQNQFGEAKNLCLEGNRLAKESLLGGAAVMNACQEVSGQQWKFVDANNGFYHLQTKFLEGDNKCLEGQGGAAPGSGAVLDGAAFMNDCQQVSGQFWKFTPIDAAMITAPTAASDATTAPAATAASDATTVPDATTAPAATATSAEAAQPTVTCDAQYANEIAKFKNDVVAEFARERDEATARDGIARSPVAWNDQMACQAQEWAQALANGTYRQNPHCCYSPIPVHSNLGSWKVGNAEGISIGKTAVEGVLLWKTSEMPNYDFAQSEAAKQKDHTCLRQICGHYGAVIGLFTLEVGCGFYPSQAGKEQNYNFVCQYLFKDPR